MSEFYSEQVKLATVNDVSNLLNFNKLDLSNSNLKDVSIFSFADFSLIREINLENITGCNQFFDEISKNLTLRSLNRILANNTDLSVSSLESLKR